MIRVRSMIPLLSVAILFIATAPAQAQSASDLFQRALRVERVEGDLDEAIQLYRQVVELDDRPLAARALLRIAESYERMGREGAEEAYRRLVSEFADQTDEADAARSRLAALTRVARDASAVGTDRAGDDRTTTATFRSGPKTTGSSSSAGGRTCQAKRGWAG